VLFFIMKWFVFDLIIRLATAPDEAGLKFPPAAQLAADGWSLEVTGRRAR
jgi:hypothetical protein